MSPPVSSHSRITGTAARAPVGRHCACAAPAAATRSAKVDRRARVGRITAGPDAACAVCATPVADVTFMMQVTRL